jgi:hypothetical protein
MSFSTTSRVVVVVGLLTTGSDLAGQESISGRVLASDSVPVGAAVVELEGVDGADTTDGDGWFTFELPPATASIPAARPGAGGCRSVMDIFTLPRAAAGPRWLFAPMMSREGWSGR